MFRPNRHLFDDIRDEDTLALIYKYRAIFPVQREFSVGADQDYEGVEGAVVLQHLTL